MQLRYELCDLLSQFGKIIAPINSPGAETDMSAATAEGFLVEAAQFKYKAERWYHRSVAAHVANATHGSPHQNSDAASLIYPDLFYAVLACITSSLLMTIDDLGVQLRCIGCFPVSSVFLSSADAIYAHRKRLALHAARYIQDASYLTARQLNFGMVRLRSLTTEGLIDHVLI